jgi:hypothetical protein
MTKLYELARLIRSKNAGPFELTFDIMFEDEARYQRVANSGVFTKERMAALYRLDPKVVAIYHCDAARAIKISIPRPYVQGDLQDSDGHGGQQYAPLVEIEIP